MASGDPESPSGSDSDSEDNGEDTNDFAANARPDVVLRPGIGQEDPQATAADLEGGHGPAIQAWHLCVLLCRLHHFMPWCTAACCRISVKTLRAACLSQHLSRLAGSRSRANMCLQSFWFLSASDCMWWSQVSCTGWKPGIVLMSRMCPGAQCTTWSCMGSRSARLREYHTGLQLHANLDVA